MKELWLIEISHFVGSKSVWNGRHGSWTKWGALGETAYRRVGVTMGEDAMKPRTLEKCLPALARLASRAVPEWTMLRLRNTETNEIIPAEIFS